MDIINAHHKNGMEIKDIALKRDEFMDDFKTASDSFFLLLKKQMRY
tara:strand:- start:388 stop:525 length:138 start_codon:yes stop_codon:yes gene_type:complete